MMFVLPPTILVASGPHGFNTNVIADRVVEIVGWGVEHCCLLARDFLRKVLGQHVPFRMPAVVWSDQAPHFVELDIACVDGEADIRRAGATYREGADFTLWVIARAVTYIRSSRRLAAL